MNPEEKRKSINAIGQKATLPCPRCGNKNFTLIDGYFNQSIQQDLSGFILGGPSIPSVVVACTNCGFLAQHALGILGLLPQGNTPNNPSGEKK